MKKAVSLWLAFVMVFMLTACGEDAKPSDETTTAATTTESIDETTTAQEGDTTTEEEAKGTTTTAKKNNKTTTKAVENVTTTVKKTTKKTTTTAKVTTTTTANATTTKKTTTSTSKVTTRKSAATSAAQVSTTAPAITISDQDVLGSIAIIVPTDDSRNAWYDHEDDPAWNKFQFVVDVFFFEDSKAKYEIETIKIVSATMGNGEKCQLLQTTNKNKLDALINKEDYIAGFWAEDAEWSGYDKEKIKGACRIISPLLLEYETEEDRENEEWAVYEYVVEIEVLFTNGITKTIRKNWTQTAGIGGPLLYEYEDQDFQD